MLSLRHGIWYNMWMEDTSARLLLACIRDQEVCIVANKEQKKVQKAAPKSNKQKKEAQREKKAAKSGTGISLKKE